VTCKHITSQVFGLMSCSTCGCASSFRTGLRAVMDSQSCVPEFRQEQLTSRDPESLICSAFSSDRSLQKNKEGANNCVMVKADRKGDFFTGEEPFV